MASSGWRPREKGLRAELAHGFGADYFFVGFADVFGAVAGVDDVLDGGFDGGGFAFEAEREAQQEGGGEDGGDGVGFVLSSDVGGGAVNGFVEAEEAVAGLARSQAVR